jgi:hypothetical protein
MSDLDNLSARAILAVLLEHLTTAVEATRAATLPWEAGEIAAKWIEHELAPLLEAYKTKMAESGLSSPLPHDGTVLPMSTDVLILPGQVFEVTTRPWRFPVRPQRLIIGGNANDWDILDIRVGNRSQFLQAGTVPGSVFSENQPGVLLNFDVAETAMDIVLIGRYVGTCKEGEPFRASMLGHVEESAPRRRTSPEQQQDLIARWHQITGRGP